MCAKYSKSLFDNLKTMLEIEPEMRNPEDLIKIQELLLNFPFFQQLQREQHINNMVDCAIYFKYTCFEPNHCIFSVSQPSIRFYILLQGQVGIFKGNQNIRTYYEGVFEERCLVERIKHDTNAMALRKSHVIHIDHLIYEGIFAKIREKRRIAMASFLHIQKEFKIWSKAKLMSLSYFINELHLDQGSVIFTLGDQSDRIYIVQDGLIILKKDKISVLSAGEVIGLEDIYKNHCRNSQCISQSKSTLLYIFKHDYLEKAKLFQKESFRVQSAGRKRSLVFSDNKHGLSIYSFSPDKNKPIKLWNFRRPATGGSLRPNSQVSQRSQIRTSYSHRPNTSLKAKTENYVKFNNQFS